MSCYPLKLCYFGKVNEFVCTIIIQNVPWPKTARKCLTFSMQTVEVSHNFMEVALEDSMWEHGFEQALDLRMDHRDKFNRHKSRDERGRQP